MTLLMSHIKCINSHFTGIEENIGTVDLDIEHPHDSPDEDDHDHDDEELLGKNIFHHSLDP